MATYLYDWPTNGHHIFPLDICVFLTHWLLPSTGVSLPPTQHLFWWTWAGPLVQQLLQCCLHQPVNSTCELQSWYRHLDNGYATHCGIHFLDLQVHTLAHFLHEPSLLLSCLWDPTGLLAWPWVMWPTKQSIKLYTYTTVAPPAVVTLDLPLQEWATFFSDQRPTHFIGKATALLGFIWVTCRHHSQTHLLFTWTL